MFFKAYFEPLRIEHWNVVPVHRPSSQKIRINNPISRIHVISSLQGLSGKQLRSEQFVHRRQRHLHRLGNKQTHAVSSFVLGERFVFLQCPRLIFLTLSQMSQTLHLRPCSQSATIKNQRRLPIKSPAVGLVEPVTSLVAAIGKTNVKRIRTSSDYTRGIGSSLQVNNSKS